ncbi:MAG: ribose-phosphate diphosphokinase [Chlamydiota bacterium]
MNKLYPALVIGLVFFTNFCSANSFECFDSPLKEDKFDPQTILFSGNANLPLAEKIANYLGTALGSATLRKFNDGEIHFPKEESIRGKNVLILQSSYTSSGQSINDSLLELYLLVRTMKRASAASITAIIPYYGHTRQDRKISQRAPVSTADIALFLEVAGVDRVATLDLQCGQIQGFFRNIPVDNLYAASLFVPYFAVKDLCNIVVISPNIEGVERAKKFAEGLEKYGISTDTALISKQYNLVEMTPSMVLVGNVKDSDVILVDDICDKADTLIKVAQLLKEQGAHRIFAIITHPVFSDSTLEKIGNSAIEEMVIADTVPLRETAPSNIRSISVAPLLGSAIRRTQVGESLAELFP